MHQARIRLELQTTVESTDHLRCHFAKFVSNQRVSIAVALQYWGQLI